MENIERLPEKFSNIKYFFSLVLEDYFGDKEELKRDIGAGAIDRDNHGFLVCVGVGAVPGEVGGDGGCSQFFIG